MDPFRYKDLQIGFTEHFIYLWNNRHPMAGTIGSQKATFWRPRISQQLFGYHPVGDCIYPHFDDINYKHMVPIVRDIEGAQGTALREPLSYEQVWDSEGFNTQNHKGSWNTSLWRPIPPPGYVAMGLVVGNGLEQPRTDAVRCLREDLVIESSIGDLIWSNRRSQGTSATPDVRCCHVYPIQTLEYRGARHHYGDAISTTDVAGYCRFARPSPQHH